MTVCRLVAKGSIDELVQSALEVKPAVLEAVIDGSALSPGATWDVLSELEEEVSQFSVCLADSDTPMMDEEWVTALLEEVEKEAETEEGEWP